MDDFKDLGFEEDFNDLGFEEEASIKPEISKLDTLSKNVGQGITAGLSDEGVGGMTAALDLGQTALNKLGLAEPSPTQVSEQLQNQGFKGDIGPTNPIDMYKQARDEERAEIKRVSDANPLTALGGNILGGVAAIPLMPSTTFASPLLNAAVTGAGYGALAGFGTSEAEAVPDMALDTATGAVLGAGTGVAMQGVASGLSAGKDALKKGAKKVGEVLDDKFPTLSEAYKEPLNISSPEYQQSVVKSQTETFTPAVKAEIQKRQDTLLKLNEESDSLAKKIQDTQDRVVAKIQKQESNLDSAKKSVAADIADSASETQAKLASHKKMVKDNFNKIDDLAKDADVAINVDSELKELEANLLDSGILPAQARGIIKGLKNKFGTKAQGLDPVTMQPTSSKGLTLASFRSLREEINNLSSNPTLIRPLKNFYSKTALKRNESLINSGMSDVADQLAKNDAAYSNIMNIEADYLGDLASSAGKIITAYKQSGNPYDATAIENLKQFKNVLNLLPEDISKEVKVGLENARIRQEALDKMKASMPNKQDLLAEAGVPELKSQAREIESKINPLKKQLETPESIQEVEQSLMGELVSGAKNLEKPATDSQRIKYENLLENYKKLTGKDITPEIEKLNTKNKILKSEGKTLEQNLEGADLNRPGSYLAPSAPKVANTVGRIVRASDDKIQQLVQSLKSQNKPGLNHAADLISQSQGKTGAARVAPMFSAMQGSPELRKLIKKEDEKK